MGFYVTFDGVSGSGKGSLIRRLEVRLKNAGKSVAVLEDNRIDPLRGYGSRIVSWCERYGINSSEFLLPLFSVGNALADEALRDALASHDVVLRDRSFITSLGYRPALCSITADQVWDLCVDALGVKVPDAAVLVDCDPSEATRRVQRRTDHVDIGFGGKMTLIARARKSSEKLSCAFRSYSPKNYPCWLLRIAKHSRKTKQRSLVGLKGCVTLFCDFA